MFCIICIFIKDIPKFIKNIKILSLLAVGFLFINLLTEYLFNFHIFKLDPILNSIYKRQTYTAGGNLNVNFDAYIIKIILNYLFSPINFKSVLFSIVALENLYVIFLMFLLLINFKKNNFQDINLAILIFIILFLSTIPFATFNIGIAIRQKWVVMIVIFSLFASGLKSYEKK